MLTFKEYSEFARLSDLYPRVTGVGGQILPVYPALAMMGEIGEVAEKLLTGKDGLLDEIGDVLWYVDAAARDLGLTLCQVVDDGRDMQTFRSLRDSILVGIGEMETFVLRLLVSASKFSERVKKYWRDGGEITLEACTIDLHGVLCDLHRVAVVAGWNLESAARANMAKLASRRARGVVSGSGDNR
jgi:hypothetical protein